jgi:hypothetical protein
MSGWMKKIKDAQQGSQKNGYVSAVSNETPGVFVVDVMKCKSGKTRPPASKENFIAELMVVESNNPAHPVGSLMDWYVDMSWDSSAADVAAFLVTATNDRQENITEEVVGVICSDANPLKGTRLRLIARNKTTEKGGTFTKCKFVAMDATPEQIAAAGK